MEPDFNIMSAGRNPNVPKLSAFDGLSDVRGLLRVAIDTLAAKLGPVLTPYGPEADVSQDQVTPLVSPIEEEIAILRRIVADVEELTRRVVV